MIAEARMARAMGRCGNDTVERLERLLKARRSADRDPEGSHTGSAGARHAADKKSADGRIRTVVCLEEIGRTTFVSAVGAGNREAL